MPASLIMQTDPCSLASSTLHTWGPEGSCRATSSVLRKRSGKSVRGWTFSPPASPWGQRFCRCAPNRQAGSFDDFHHNFLALAGSCCLRNGADGFGNSSLFADDLAHVIWRHSQLQDHGLFAFNLVHGNSIWLIYQCLAISSTSSFIDCHSFDFSIHGTFSSRLLSAKASCCVSWLAPFCNQERALSSSTSTLSSEVRGLYQPSSSMNLPSLGGRGSATTRR